MDWHLIFGVVMLLMLVGCMIVLARRKPNRSRRVRADDFE